MCKLVIMATVVLSAALSSPALAEAVTDLDSCRIAINNAGKDTNSHARSNEIKAHLIAAWQACLAKDYATAQSKIDLVSEIASDGK